jgi:hypothetical protein
MMFISRCSRLLALVLVLALCGLHEPLAAQTDDRVRFAGKDLFLNGLNLAWQSFADDIGPNPDTPDLPHFERVFQEMSARGANVMRLWLHTTGAHTPAWDGHLVTGPGTDTIEDLRAILDLAWRYDVSLMLCLWSFDMLRISNGTTVTDRAMAILTLPSNRQSYIDNALIPMVTALEGHPAILCWEIFNEPEGMSVEFGWNFNRHVPMAAIQAFVNQCAGAIRRADPGVLISNGSWSFHAATDVGEGNFNYYTDERLVAAGGDPDGTLDFYMVHYYDWAGTGRSPFHHPASHWGLDKPLVVAEFYPNCDNCGPTSHAALYAGGYAGALSWSWTDVDPTLLLDQIEDVASRHPGEILLAAPAERPQVTLTLPTSGTWFAAGVPVPLTAEAAQTGGEIQSVTFYMDGQPLGVDTEAPFTIEVSLNGTGTRTFHAVAENAEGKRRSSPPVLAKVGRPELLGRLEAEDAVLTGVDVRMAADASGGRAVEMRGSGALQWTLEDVPEAGLQNLVIGYNLNFSSPKTNVLTVNGTTQPVVFDGPAGQWAERTVSVPLRAGANVISLTPSWGWMMFDFIAIPSLAAAVPLELKVEMSLREGNARVALHGPPGLDYELMYSPDLRSWTLTQSFHPNVMPTELSTPLHDTAEPSYFQVRATRGD